MIRKKITKNITWDLIKGHCLLLFVIVMSKFINVFVYFCLHDFCVSTIVYTQSTYVN